MELHGHRVIYRVAGSGPPVVLIHGMINSSRHWEAVAQRLAGSLQGDRAGPDRPRRRGDAARRLLARRPRGGDPRPADDDRGRAGDDRRPLARRRRRDAVLLPVPPAHRAPGADLQRRPRARGQPAAARRRAARAQRRCCGWRRTRGWSDALAGAGARLRERGNSNGVYLQAVARALRPLQEPGSRARLPADAALGDRRPRPAGQRPRPPLPARRDADADRLGRARPHDPARARPRRRTRRSPTAASRPCRAPPTSPTSRTRRGWRACSATSSRPPRRPTSRTLTGAGSSRRGRRDARQGRGCLGRREGVEEAGEDPAQGLLSVGVARAVCGEHGDGHPLLACDQQRDLVVYGAVPEPQPPLKYSRQPAASGRGRRPSAAPAPRRSSRIAARRCRGATRSSMWRKKRAWSRRRCGSVPRPPGRREAAHCAWRATRRTRRAPRTRARGRPRCCPSARSSGRSGRGPTGAAGGRARAGG